MEVVSKKEKNAQIRRKSKGGDTKWIDRERR